MFAANAGDPEAANAAVAATIERFGRLDILVNNAATNPYMGPMIDIDLPRLDKTYDVNLRGAFVWVQEAWQQAFRASGGNVINISSIGGMSVETSIGHYNVTKAALIHLTRSLARDLAPGVRVNAICPGLVKTDMARVLWQENEEAIAAVMPLKRLGEPDDIANAAVFLASDAASWITGTTIVVDGGALLALEGSADGSDHETGREDMVVVDDPAGRGDLLDPRDPRRLVEVEVQVAHAAGPVTDPVPRCRRWWPRAAGVAPARPTPVRPSGCRRRPIRWRRHDRRGRHGRGRGRRRGRRPRARPGPATRRDGRNRRSGKPSGSGGGAGRSSPSWASCTTMPCASAGWRKASCHSGSSRLTPTGVEPAQPVPDRACRPGRAP